MARSLRFRLTFAFAAMVALILAVGVTSAWIHRGIQERVALLRPASGLDLENVDLDRIGLEVEGFWDPSVGFVATDVEAIPGTRRPRLRGAVQAVGDGSLTVFGTVIHLDAETAVVDPEPEPAALSGLKPGDHIEVTCDVTDGRWRARKVQTQDVKPSDKIKGTVTGWDRANGRLASLDFHGLRVALSFERRTAPESALTHLRRATGLLETLQEYRAGAYALIERPGAAGGRLDGARRDFVHQLSAAGDGSGAPNRWLRATTDLLPELVAHTETLQGLAATDPVAARAYLADPFEKFLDERLVPHVQAYLSQSKDDLGDQLRTMSVRAAATSRIALGTSAVAALVALVLGFLVWRSVHRPLVALHAAARRLGQGQLDTRVEVPSGDELGDLAESFNRMAARLATSTVSIDNLENVLDSMAGALFLLGPDRTFTHVNRAGLELLGYASDELLGLPFDVVDATGIPFPQAAERELVRKDGRRVPVSFSAARLRAGDASGHGWVCLAQDLTERRRIEEQVRRSLQEKELLLREVHHRVKNNMQVISSMLAMQAGRSEDPRVVEGFEQSQARIRSMALIHEQLYRSADLASIDVRVYLELLTHHLQRSLGDDGRVGVELELDEVSLDLDQSLACGLIVNEVVSNAYQHAFADGRTGVIRVRLSELDGDRVRLSVSDDGRGMASPQPGQPRGSLGLELVETLGRQLGGEVLFESARGLTVSLEFPRTPAETAAV